MTTYYVDVSGNYLGGFDGADPPAGAIEVPSAPSNALQKWIAGAWVDPVPVVADYESAVQAMLDAEAKQFGYDNIISASSYAGDPDPTFNDEGTKLKAWRSACWRQCISIMAQVQAQQIPQPTVEQLLAMLPESPL